jgi:hypothetical protein
MAVKKKQPAKGKNKGKKTRRKVALKPSRVKEDKIFGFMVGKMKIVGDIESPLPDWKY